MTRSVKGLHRCTVVARDGDIGQISDLYFDDERWVIRYLVVDAKKLEQRRPVLISPMSVAHVDWASGAIALSVTTSQVRNSPDINTDKPVLGTHTLIITNAAQTAVSDTDATHAPLLVIVRCVAHIDGP